jgi:hypothetical protein
MGKHINPVWLAQYFGFDLIDYKRIGDGVLIASGCGIMMSIMDAVPRFQYCIDVDSFRHNHSRLPQLLSAFDKNCHFKVIGIAGWFSLDKPDALRQGQQRITNAQCVTYSGGYSAFTDEAKTLKDFIDKSLSVK